jgi:PAS domain S-box-containing protein
MSLPEYRQPDPKLYNWAALIAILVGLYLTTRVNYLLFHSIVELVSIVIAATVFIITFNSIRYIENAYLVMVGIASLFIGILDLLHTLSFKGMPIFTDYDYYANQLWIAARYLESLTLLVSFFLLYTRRKVNPALVIAGYLIVTGLLVASILHFKVFPVCFIEGRGLTPFKVYSEYVICGILAASMFMLTKSRRFFSPSVYRLLMYSMMFAIGSEICFTIYVDNYGISNLVGHYFKLFAFLMIYRAIVATGIEEPYRLIFWELNQANHSLKKEVELRKELEAERERAMASLRESEERYRSLFESTPAAVFLTVPEGAIVAANRAATAMFGLSEEEICRGGRYALICHDEMRHKALAEERFRTGRFLNEELCYVRKNGERFPGETDSVLLPGEPPRAFVIVRDITERKRTEAALKDLNQELEKRVAERTAELHQKDQLLLVQGRQAAMGEMISHIAHQWRQPLNTLALLVQEVELTFEMGGLEQSYLQAHVERSMQLIQHMSRTVDDFRNFFKPDKERVAFNPLDVVRRTVSMIEGTFRELRIAVEVVSQGDAVMTGFPNEFSQVILNILVNAKDALVERNVEQPKVVVVVGREGERSVVTITDNAGGIPAEIIEHVFDPYFTTKGPQSGTGVGLSMSKTIIEKNMAGSLTVRNVAGGAQFRIEV